MSSGFQAMQQKGKLSGLLETQAEEIRELKGLLYAQGKELVELKKLIKGIVKKGSSGCVRAMVRSNA